MRLFSAGHRCNWKLVVLSRSVILILLTANSLSISAQQSSAQTRLIDGENPRPTIAPMLADVTPGVVNVSVTGSADLSRHPFLDDPFFRRFFNLPDDMPVVPTQTVGSGVIVDATHGYVLTNHHVIDQAEQVLVTLQDQRQFDAELVGSDEGTDIALLQIAAEDLHPLRFGDSDELKVGDFVAAIGNPFGLGQTVTVGIVSALGRSGLNIENYENFIQTDASINPGNSGGALVDFNGEVIGINTAIISPAGGNVGIGFAIPINMARSIMNQLAEYGVVRRGRLGILIQTVTPDLAEALDLTVSDGVLVTLVEPDSAADKAGIRTGDVIETLNGEPITGAGQLRNLIGLMRVDEEVELSIVRGGKRRLLNAIISDTESRQPKQVAEVMPALAGATFEAMTEDHELFDKTPGVVVPAVISGSPAWRIGLRPGDVILAVNRRPVSSVDELSDVIRSEDDAVALNVARDGARFFILVQ